MTKIEFLLMVPALLYGISLAELALFLGKASAGRKKLYWEHFILIIICFEAILFNWFVFYDRIENIEMGYSSFLIQLLPPAAALIFVANLLIETKPDEPRAKYFLDHRKRIFLSLGLFAVINVSTIIYFHRTIHIATAMPAIPAAIILLNAFFNVKPLRIFLYIAKAVGTVIACIYLGVG
jgi:hypothetical protein